MKDPAWMRDKLQAIAIEADEMLGSCDASDILDVLEEARNAMFEGAEVIARLMVELEQAKRERDAAVRDMMHAASPEGSYCDICVENDKDPCRGRFVAYDCFRWRGVQGLAVSSHEKAIAIAVAHECAGIVRDVPAVDAVPRDEHEALLRRFRHLLQSDFIRSFDKVDPKTGAYKRDISEADKAEHVWRGKWFKPTGMMPPEHHGRHRCDRCKQLAPCNPYGREKLTDFCPGCGAKMDKEE